VGQQIENALNLIVCTTEQNGNMKKELKETIVETVSNLRTLFVKLRASGDSKTSEISKLTEQITKPEAELQQGSDTQARGHRTPSIVGDTVLAATTATEYGTPSSLSGLEPAGKATRCMALPTDRLGKLYAAAVKEMKAKTCKMTVRSKGTHVPETIKQIMKAKIKPSEIKVGINTFKTLNSGKVLIETHSKEEIEALGKDIEAKCEDDLEINIHTLRKPRLIILNIPEDISTTNIEDRILMQNADLNLRKGEIVAKFSYVTKKMNRNLVVEVGADTRKILLQRKIKIGWQICRIEDYLVANRCFKCSRFNHRHRDCRGEVTCPLCTGPHTLKECKAVSMEHKCINCVTFNKHNQSKNVSVNHSSLDKKCPSMLAIIENYRLNT
jgi:hypothetical protein